MGFAEQWLHETRRQGAYRKMSNKPVLGLITDCGHFGGEREWSLSWYDLMHYGAQPYMRRFVADGGRRFHFEVWVGGLRYWSERRVTKERAIQLAHKYGYLGSSKPSWIPETDWGEKRD